MCCMYCIYVTNVSIPAFRHTEHVHAYVLYVCTRVWSIFTRSTSIW